jgi:peptide/nickel transport system substrate-binding protein
MRRHGWLAGGLAVVVVAAVLSGPAVSAPALRTLVVGVGHDQTTLDPARGYEIVGGLVHKATYNTLVTLAPGDIGTIVPDLAERWRVTPDGKTYVFTLRRGVRFVSGNELTAEDVKWSYERVKGIRGNPSFLFDTIQAVEVRDARTVVLRLTQPDPALLAKMTFGAFAVLDSKTVQARGGVSGPDARERDQAQRWLDQNSAGTGPFILRRWVRESEVVVERNPTYWGGPPKLDRVIFRHLPQSATQKLALEAGDIDIALELNAEQARALAANPNVQIVRGPTTDLFFLLANRNPALSGGIMSNPKVVQAIRYAIDYQGIKELAGGVGITPPTLVGVGFAGAWDESRAPRRDLARARQLLAEAGYPTGFEIELEYATKLGRSGVEMDLLAPKIQADLAEVGIRVRLKPGDLQTTLANYRAGNEAFGLWLWGADFPDINDRLAFLPNGIVGRRAGWTDDRADEVIKSLRDQAMVETDPRRRAQIWDRIQAYLVENSPFVPLIQPVAQVALRRTVKGYVFNNQFRVQPFLLSKD